MKRSFLILILAIAFCLDMPAKDILLYSYQAKKIEFSNQSFIALLYSIIGHTENMSCHCDIDSIVYNVSFSKTADWPLDRRVVIGVYIDDMQHYLYKDWKYVTFFNRKGKIYRINVSLCCEEDTDWIKAASSEFFIVTDYITQKKFKRQYSEIEFQMLYERCQPEDDGGTEIYFVYEDGVIAYWRGHFCDRSIIYP